MGGVLFFFELADFLEHSAEPFARSNSIFLRYKRTWPLVPLGPKNFLTVHFYPFPIWRPQAAQPLTGIESRQTRRWPNASCTADHPERGFYQSHRHQTDHWFPGRPPKTEGSRPGPEEEAPSSGKAPAPRGSGPPSAAGGWCKGRRWGTGWRRTRPRLVRLEPESR